MCLRRATCLSYSPFRRCRIWVWPLDLDPKGAKITCPAFGMYSSPDEYSTMGHIVLDLTSLAYQPKLRERPARPTKHVVFALVAKKISVSSACSRTEWRRRWHNLLFVQTALRRFWRRGWWRPLINLWCHLHQEKNQWKTSVNLPPHADFPHQLRRRKGPPVWRDPSATREQSVSGTSRERSEDFSRLGKNYDGDALHKITNKLLDVRNLKDLHLKHYHMSSAQFKEREQLTWICQGKFMTFTRML